jgi:hypothetical protein
MIERILDWLEEIFDFVLSKFGFLVCFGLLLLIVITWFNVGLMRTRNELEKHDNTYSLPLPDDICIIDGIPQIIEFGENEISYIDQAGDLVNIQFGLAVYYGESVEDVSVRHKTISAGDLCVVSDSQ